MAKKIWIDGKRQKKNMICCVGRPNTCNNISFLHAEESEFHDATLEEATDEFNRTFARLHDLAPPGRHLALIDTRVGLLLVWAEAAERPPDLSEYTWYESPEEEIRSALGLAPAEAAAAG